MVKLPVVGVFTVRALLRFLREVDEFTRKVQLEGIIETGKYDPSLPLAFKIAAVFKQPIESIFDPGTNA
ncbi:MAG: hypothetical protein ABIP38_11350 [Steroidobacteraceae bacterium]